MCDFCYYFANSTNKLQFAISVQPEFISAQIRNNIPQQDITTLYTQSKNSTSPSALMRLLNYGLSLDDPNYRINCTVGYIVESSQVTLAFDYFGNMSLDYDPGIYEQLHNEY